MTHHLTRFILFIAVAGLTGCDVKPPDKLEPPDPTQHDVRSEPAGSVTTPQDTTTAAASDRTAGTEDRTALSQQERTETGAQDIPVWTSIRGDTIQADFIRMEESLCVFRTADGTLIRVPLSHLSAADAERVQALTEQ